MVWIKNIKDDEIDLGSDMIIDWKRMMDGNGIMIDWKDNDGWKRDNDILKG